MNAFFRGLSAAGSLHPRADPSQHGVEVLRDISYGATSDAQLALDIYRPKEREGPLPILFYVHGGGFQILSKDTHWVMALGFARAGYVVFNIDYRLSPEFRFPEGLLDVCEAFQWVARYGADFGGDVDRIVLAGESAGANLVTALTILTCFERDEEWAKSIYALDCVPSAVLPACGVLQVSDIGRFGRDKGISRFVDDRLREVENNYRPLRSVSPETRELMDPLCILESDKTPDRALPPFAAICGTKDPLLDDSKRLQRALEKRNVRCDVSIHPGELHAFHAFVWRPAAQKAWNFQLEFLNEFVGDAPID